MNEQTNFERAGDRPGPAPGLPTPGSRPPPCTSLECSFTALCAFKSRVLLRNSIRFVGVGTTTTLLAVQALTETNARPSDARTNTTTSRFIGVFFCCALYHRISRTLTEPHRVRRRRHNDHAPRCSSSPQELYVLCALDLLA